MRKLQISEWGSIAEVVTAIAVVISLIYVGLEVQRNTVARVQTSTQALITDINRTYESIAEGLHLHGRARTLQAARRSRRDLVERILR